MVTVGKISAVTFLQVTHASVTRGDFPLTTTLRAACPLARNHNSPLSSKVSCTDTCEILKFFFGFKINKIRNFLYIFCLFQTQRLIPYSDHYGVDATVATMPKSRNILIL